MQYDWTGVRTRRIWKLKMLAFTSGGVFAAFSFIALTPGFQFAPWFAMPW